jgi:hypothetical protein
MNEEQIQEQPQSAPYYQPTIMPSEKADLFDKINPDDVVAQLKWVMMGYEYNAQKMQWERIKEYSSRALTKLGAMQIAGLMLSVSSKNVTISKLNDGEIRDRTKALIRTAMNMCLRNWKEYGIKTPDQIFFIKEIILSNTFITLKQPENAGVRQFIQGTTQESVIRQEHPQNKGGITGFLFRK